ncbi:MAG: hypothetical protein MJ126_08955 [Lachnospiraceae bacterium]|nr:hypothetical protein [Lachnospiraceae bacterium]
MNRDKDIDKIKKEIDEISSNLASIKESHKMIGYVYEDSIINYDRALEQDYWTNQERDFLEEQQFKVMKMRDREESHYYFFEQEFKKDIERREEDIEEINREIEREREREEAENNKVKEEEDKKEE